MSNKLIMLTVTFARNDESCVHPQKVIETQASLGPIDILASPSTAPPKLSET